MRWDVTRPRLRADEVGATAVEYAFMVALVAMVIIAGVIFLGNAVSDQYDCTAQHVDTLDDPDGLEDVDC